MGEGFMNQHTALYGSYMLSFLKGWDLVLPHWRIGSTIKESTLMPFSYFYEIDIEKYNAMQTSFVKVIEQLPASFSFQCLAELQCDDACNYPNLDLMKSWAANFGVVCINTVTSLHIPFEVVKSELQGNSNLGYDQLNHFRNSLNISPLFQSISNSILEKLFDDTEIKDYAVVHYRQDEDFINSCYVGKRKAGPDGNLISCMEWGDTLEMTIDNANLPNGTTLLIMNHEHKDIKFEKLKNICERKCTGAASIFLDSCKVYNCVRKETVWSRGTPPPIPEEKQHLFLHHQISYAMVDFTLAQSENAKWFFGNFYSDFSAEIYYRRKGNEQHVALYNKDCTSYPTNHCP